MTAIDGPKNGSKDLAGWLEQSLDTLIETVATRPEKVLREAMQRGLEPLGDSESERLESLQRFDPAKLDSLARSFVRTNTKIAGGQGFVTGLGGLLTLPVTVPADTLGFLVWLIRATSGTMHSYGFESHSEEGQTQLKLGLLASAGVAELTVAGSNVLVAGLTKQVMTRPYREAVIQATIKALASKVGVTLTHRSFTKVVPIVGGVINGSVNAGLVYGFGRRAQTHYRTLLIERIQNSDGDDGVADAR